MLIIEKGKHFHRWALSLIAHVVGFRHGLSVEGREMRHETIDYYRMDIPLIARGT